jgi:hypothetical protein
MRLLALACRGSCGGAGEARPCPCSRTLAGGARQHGRWRADGGREGRQGAPGSRAKELPPVGRRGRRGAPAGSGGAEGGRESTGRTRRRRREIGGGEMVVGDDRIKYSIVEIKWEI